jgi:hypothetical protein
MTAGFGHRTPEQVAEALEKAQDARRIRSRILAEVRTGELTLERLLSDEFAENRAVQQLPVRTLLNALPGATPAQVRHLMDGVPIMEKRRVGGLGLRQREAILEWRRQ